MDSPNSKNYADYESFLTEDTPREPAQETGAVNTESASEPVHHREHSSVKERIDSTMDTAASKLRDVASKTERSARGTEAYGPASKVSEQLRRGAGYLESTNVDTVLVKTRDTVRRNPLATMGAAFGIGFLIALVLRK
ncbi:MAG: hypothetical protein H7Y22_03485 [Gemmatimonadaceae bacterium]|nr:hypothetical protein [Gloeobacterales cyanobacterium ES-bin-141]